MTYYMHLPVERERTFGTGWRAQYTHATLHVKVFFYVLGTGWRAHALLVHRVPRPPHAGDTNGSGGFEVRPHFLPFGVEHFQSVVLCLGEAQLGGIGVQVDGSAHSVVLSADVDGKNVVDEDPYVVVSREREGLPWWYGG